MRFILSLAGGGVGADRATGIATGIVNGGKIFNLVISKPDLKAKGLENLVCWEF